MLTFEETKFHHTILGFYLCSLQESSIGFSRVLDSVEGSDIYLFKYVV